MHLFSNQIFQVNWTTQRPQEQKGTVIKSTTICVEMLQKFESVYKYIESKTPQFWVQVLHHEPVYKYILWWNETVIFFICQLLRLHYFEEEEKSYLSKHGQWWHSKRGYIDIERALPGSFWKKCLTLEVIWRIGSSGSGSTLMGVSCTFVWLSLNGCCQKLCDDQKRFWGVKTEGSMLMRKVVSLWYGSWIEVRQRW